MKRFSRAGSLVLLFLFVMTSLLSCGSSGSYDYAPSEKYNAVMEADGFGYDVAGSYTFGGGYAADDAYPEKVSSVTAETPRGENPEKLVYSADLSLETMEFDAAVAAIREQISAFGGIVQSENFSDDMPSSYYYGTSTYYKVSGYKNFRAVIRIPTERFQEFLDTVSEVGHLRSSSSDVTNITQEYYSNKSYLDSYRAQMEVLQGMYDQAKTIDEMITIESRIAEVQAQINRLTTVINSMDRDVAYSTVTLRVEEVEVYSDTPREAEEKSFLQNVGSHMVSSFRNFVDFLEEFVYWLIDSFWGLLIAAGVLVLLFFLLRKLIRLYRRKAAEAPRSAPYAAYAQMQKPAAPGTAENPEDSGKKS